MFQQQLNRGTELCMFEVKQNVHVCPSFFPAIFDAGMGVMSDYHFHAG
jgi:hypothetical protein